jgi:hypothetical protein
MYRSGYGQINYPAPRKQRQTNGNISLSLQENWRSEALDVFKREGRQGKKCRKQRRGEVRGKISSPEDAITWLFCTGIASP